MEINLSFGLFLTPMTMRHVIQMVTPLQQKKFKLYCHYSLIVCNYLKKCFEKPIKNQSSCYDIEYLPEYMCGSKILCMS